MNFHTHVKLLKIAFFGTTLFLSFSRADVSKIYRCGEPGKYTFSSLPCGKNAESVEIETSHISTDSNPYTKIVEDYKQDLKKWAKEKKKNQFEVEKLNAKKADWKTGLSLQQFNRLEVGMSEGEVIVLVGAPDRENIDSVNTHNGLTTKSYYYVKRGFNTNVSRIIFLNGNIISLERSLIVNP